MFAVFTFLRPIFVKVLPLCNAVIENAEHQPPFDVAVGHIVPNGVQFPYFRYQRVGQAVDERAAFL